MPNVYLALEPCGCFVGIEPPVTDLLKDWTARGFTIEKVSSAVAEEARQRLFCDEHQPQRKVA